MKDTRIEKIKKHYKILVDGREIKIINHSITNDDKLLRIRTKVRGQTLSTNSIVIIEIPTQENNIVLNCKYKTLLSTPVLEEREFEIIK